MSQADGLIEWTLTTSVPGAPLRFSELSVTGRSGLGLGYGLGHFDRKVEGVKELECGALKGRSRKEELHV